MPFIPADLPGTLSWWDASDTATITTFTPGGNTVSGLADKINNYAPYINGDFSSGMNTGVETVNGLNTISSVGTNGSLPRYQALRQGEGGVTSVPYQIGFPGAAGTIYMVVQIDVSSSQAHTFTVRDVASGGRWMMFDGNDNYHLFYYGSFQANNINVNRHGLEFPNNSYMDTKPHIWKMTWSAATGIASTSFDGGNRKFLNGFTDYGSTSWQGIELNTNTFGLNTDRLRFCEMSLHSVVIPDGSDDDLRMLAYLRNKWGTPGLPPLTTSTAVIGSLSGGSKVRSLQIANDGTLVMSSDAPNCWKWIGGTVHRFTNLFAQTSLPAAFQDWGTDTAFQAYEIGVCPTNSQIMYVVANLSGGNGQIWKSINGGSTWTDQGRSIPFARHDPGPSIAVDPANSNHVIIGASNGHLFETLDGNIWTDRTIGTGSSYACIAYDTNSGTTLRFGTTVTTNVYVGWSAGTTLIFRSIDGGANFASLPSSPPTARSICCGADGVVYLCDNTGIVNSAWKFAAGTWTNLTISATGSTWVYCAVDRLINGHAAFITGDCKLQYTVNAGSTFYGTSSGTPFSDFHEANEVGWTVNPYHGNLLQGNAIPPNFGFNYVRTGSRLAFSNNSRLYLGSSAGVFYTNPDDYVGMTTPTISWNQQVGGAPGIQINDLVKSYSQSVDEYADTAYALVNYSGSSTTGGYTEPTYFAGGDPITGLAVDYDKAAPTNHFLLLTSGLRFDSSYGAGGYTTIQGPVTSLGSPAMMAASTNLDVTVISSAGSSVWTNNRGSSWNFCLFSGVPATFTFGKCHTLVCDGVIGTTLYFVRPDTGACWRSIDKGANWSPRGAPGAFSTGDAQLCSVFGQSQQLFFAHGKATAAPLKRSVDGGTSWQAVTNVTQAWQVSAGAANPDGAGYPCVYITGLISGDPDPGVFRAENFTFNTGVMPTWTRVCRAPAGNMDATNKLYADLNVYGDLYITMETAGFVYVKLNTSEEPPPPEPHIVLAHGAMGPVFAKYVSRPTRIPQI